MCFLVIQCAIAFPFFLFCFSICPAPSFSLSLSFSFVFFLHDGTLSAYALPCNISLCWAIDAVTCCDFLLFVPFSFYGSNDYDTRIDHLFLFRFSLIIIIIGWHPLINILCLILNLFIWTYICNWRFVFYIFKTFFLCWISWSSHTFIDFHTFLLPYLNLKTFKMNLFFDILVASQRVFQCI